MHNLELIENADGGFTVKVDRRKIGSINDTGEYWVYVTFDKIMGTAKDQQLAIEALMDFAGFGE